MTMKFINYTKSSIPRILRERSSLNSSAIEQIHAASHVFPFRANNYVVDHLIDWSNVLNAPIFKLPFPQSGMLSEGDMTMMLDLQSRGDRQQIRQQASAIRNRMNPHPAKQKELNVPVVGNERVFGAQHKYRETMLFFPSEAQWCHSYCTYCFRWAQFTEVGSQQQFKSKDVDGLVRYVAANKQLTDVLFTGGDPMVMRTPLWRRYLDPLIDGRKETAHISTIRVGTKSLTYWPYRYTHDDDADDLLRLFERVSRSGKHLTIQAHFTHPHELQTPQVEEAVRSLRMTGANIRTQAPIVRGINDDSAVWADMWTRQVTMGMVPYYMFIERDTGPRHYFELPLVRAHRIFKEAVSKVSGIARTVRGPSMSCEPGKLAVVGVVEELDAMVLQFLQARNPEWMNNPFLAKLDDQATWLDQLEPYSGESFFFEQELQEMQSYGVSSGQMVDAPKRANERPKDMVGHNGVDSSNGTKAITDRINGSKGSKIRVYHKQQARTEEQQLVNYC